MFWRNFVHAQFFGQKFRQTNLFPKNEMNHTVTWFDEKKNSKNCTIVLIAILLVALGDLTKIFELCEEFLWFWQHHNIISFLIDIMHERYDILKSLLLPFTKSHGLPLLWPGFLVLSRLQLCSSFTIWEILFFHTFLHNISNSIWRKIAKNDTFSHLCPKCKPFHEIFFRKD